MKKNQLTLAIILIALILTTTLSAQVTIGSATPPRAGALLDLNEGATTNRGLNLPRVTLTNLKPTTPAELAASIGATGTWSLTEHIGLMVYNVFDGVQCGRPAGIYYWEGENWMDLFGKSSDMGSYARDVAALKEIYNNNPGHSLDWDLSANPSTFSSVTWVTVCGEQRVTGLFLMTENLSNLDAIGKFKMLTYLECSYNPLMTSLDVSGATALEELWCYNNPFLTSLDVSGATALTLLYCHDAPLTSLDVSENIALRELNCNNNQLTNLDVSKNTALTKFSCERNQLTSLDVSKNTALTMLSCQKNKLTRLDISKNTALTMLSCEENQLTQIELNKLKDNPRYCGGQITSLFVTPQYLADGVTDNGAVNPTCP